MKHEPDLYKIKGATLSECGDYRYTLTRVWGRTANTRFLYFVMLNPSLADALIDDRTIRRIVSFAKRDGYDGIFVANLFALRSKYPTALDFHINPTGHDNTTWLEQVLIDAAFKKTPVVCAWGAEKIARLEAAAFLELARKHGTRLVCLGKTNAGHPRHPLYLGGSTPFEDFA